MDVIGQDRWPPIPPKHHQRTHTLAHLHAQTHAPRAQPLCLVVVVVACSGASLILSLRAAGESYICAAFACDVGTEIEEKEPPFEPTIQLPDISG